MGLLSQGTDFLGKGILRISWPSPYYHLTATSSLCAVFHFSTPLTLLLGEHSQMF